MIHSFGSAVRPISTAMMIFAAMTCLVGGYRANPSVVDIMTSTTAHAADDTSTRVWSECWARPGREPWCPPIERNHFPVTAQRTASSARRSI